MADENIVAKAVQAILVPQPCFDRYFVDFDFLNGACAKVVISKGLGLGIILGSVLVKLPQILKIISAKSGEGISFTSVLVELLAISFTFSYGFQKEFPFSSYGEGSFLAIQTSIIAALVLFYGGNLMGAVLFLVGYGTVMFYLMSPLASLEILTMLQSVNIALLIISRLLQITANFRNGGTGQLSAVTVFLLFAGAISRIFTSIQETGDSLIIANYIVASLLNGIIFSQVLYYWKKEKTD